MEVANTNREDGIANRHAVGALTNGREGTRSKYGRAGHWVSLMVRQRVHYVTGIDHAKFEPCLRVAGDRGNRLDGEPEASHSATGTTPNYFEQQLRRERDLRHVPFHPRGTSRASSDHGAKATAVRWASDGGPRLCHVEYLGPFA